MRIRISCALFAIVSLAAINLAEVAVAVPLDSSLFNHQYNGDVVPVPNYTENGGYAAGPSTDGDIMTYRVGQGGGYLSSDDWSVNHATGYTVEFRIKIDEDFPEGSKGAVALYFADGTAGDVLSVGESSVWVGIGAIQVDSNSNSDGYHTFRVAQDGGTPTPINFWRDGVLIHTWPNGGNWGANVLYFGSGGSPFGGPTVHVDYLRWDNTGAFEPVPEPGTCTLLAIGSVGLVVAAVRRRNHRS